MVREMRAFQFVLCGAAVAAALGSTARANAQLTATVEAFAGYYRPYGHFYSPSNLVTQLPKEPSDLEGPAWGATAHLGLGHRFGVAGEVAATSNHVIPEVITPSGFGGPTNASVALGVLLAQYDLSPTPSAYHVWLNAGPAVIHHRGDAYSFFGAPTSVGSALGMTIVIPLRWHLDFSADATGLFYSLDVPTHHELDMDPGSIQHGDQRDALLRLGIAWKPF